MLMAGCFGPHSQRPTDQQWLRIEICGSDRNFGWSGAYQKMLVCYSGVFYRKKNIHEQLYSLRKFYERIDYIIYFLPSWVRVHGLLIVEFPHLIHFKSHPYSFPAQLTFGYLGDAVGRKTMHAATMVCSEMSLVATCTSYRCFPYLSTKEYFDFFFTSANFGAWNEGFACTLTFISHRLHRW